ncbi:MAG: EthD domain-containing protein [Pseudomonadota bacterium]
MADTGWIERAESGAVKQFHSVYVQCRQPGISRSQFQRLWRSHGDYAASVPAFWRNVERYVHNDPVDPAAGVPADTARFDGVGELFYTSFDIWLGMRDVMWNEVAPDEKRVFAGPPTVSTRGTRTAYQPPRGTCKLFTFAAPRPGTDPDRLDTMLDDHALTTLALTGFGGRLAGYTTTRALRPDAGSGMQRMAQTSSSHELLFIHHFEDEHAALAALASADHARLEVAQDALFDWDTRVVILTHGWVLKGDIG